MAFGERKLNPLFCYRSITRLMAYGHVTVGGQHETVRIHANLVAGSSNSHTSEQQVLVASGSEGVSLSLVARRGHSHSVETPRGTDLVPPQVSSSAANAQQPTRLCPPRELSSTTCFGETSRWIPLPFVSAIDPNRPRPSRRVDLQRKSPPPIITQHCRTLASPAPETHGKQRVQIQLHPKTRHPLKNP